MIMESAKNVRWVIPFKKFGMVRVNRVHRIVRIKNNYLEFSTGDFVAILSICVWNIF